MLNFESHHLENGSVVKNLPGNTGGMGSVPGLRRSSGEGIGNPLQYSCLGNPMDRGAWRATVHGVTKSWTRLNNNNLESNVVVVQSQLCPTLCHPMDCNMPGLFVPHHLQEFTQVHAHWISDAIQSSHPLSSPAPAFNLSQHQGLFQWVGSWHQVAKVLELQLQHQSFQDWSLKSSGPYEALLPVMLVEVIEFQLSYLKY